MAIFQNGSLIEQVSVIATAGGTTTLAVSSKELQIFTGTLGQTIVLPDATTYTQPGAKFEVYNTSTGTLTVNMHGSTLLKSISPNTDGAAVVIKLIDNSTAAGTWVILNGTSPVLTGDVTSASGVTSYHNIVPVIKGGTGLSSTPGSAQILIGNASNAYSLFGITGDISLSAGGVTAYSGTVPINKGGTGQTSANSSLNALLPTQTSNATKALVTDGTNATWQPVSSLPSQSGNAGKILTTDGTNSSWTNSPTMTNPTWTTQTLTYGGTTNWNMDNGGAAQLTLTGSTTMATPTNLKAGATYVLKVIQGTGGQTIAWTSGVFQWPAATAPVLSTTAGAVDLISFFCYDGTHLVGSYLRGIA
jgi:hypothetical protein